MKDVTIHLGSTMMSSSHINKLGRAPVMQQCPQHLDHIQSAVEEYVLDDRNFRSFHLVNVPFEKNPHRTMNRHRHVRRSAELRTVSIIETLSELVAHTDACHYCGRHDDCDGRCLDMQKSSVAGCQKPAKKVHHHRRCDHTEFCKKSLHRFSEVDEATLEPSSGTSDMTQKATCTCQNSSKSFVVCDDTNLIRRHNYSKPVDRTANVGRKRQQKKVIAECVLPQCSSCLEHDTETRDNSNPLKYSNATWSSSDMDCYKIRSKCSSNINLKNELAISSSFPAPSKTAAVESEATSLPTVNSGRTLPSKMHCNFGNGRIEVAKMKANNTKKRSSSLLCNEYGNGVGVDNTTKYCSHVVHDPSHFMLSTLKSKGRTPDWIAGIFSIARRGNLDSLNEALLDMDATLIRNLSDHRGNNLFHVCCCFGHLDCLQWLMQRGKQCEDAILDENKCELTPVVCAVKYGKLPCVEWLIHNTIARGQLNPGNGGRPLLHWAAKYGQEVILRWLADYMTNNGMDVNVKDGYGNTALHLAAKHGHATSIKALVMHRCDVSLKNDLGYKASDFAVLYSQIACSEFLLCLEACLLLSSDVVSLDNDLNSSKNEVSELKIQFKDVLSCAKKLVKEREELSQHLDKLQDSIVHLNSVIISTIQTLSDENSILRQPMNSAKKSDNSLSLDEATSVLHALVAKWQDGQRQKWLSPSVLSELQQKILLAEERWKRARARVNMGEKESKEFLTIFRDRLTQVQCRTPGIHLSDIRSISSSESSLASMEDALSEYDDHYESVLTQKKTIPLPMKCCHNNKVINCWECYAHQLPLPAVKNSNMDKGHEKPLVVDSTIEDCSLCPTTPTHKTGSSQFSKSSNYPSQFGYKCAPNGISIRGSSLTPLQQESCENHPENGHASGMNVLTKGTCKVLEVIVSSNRDVNKDQESVRHTDCIDVISKFTSQQKCLASSGKNELPPTRLFNSNNNKGTLTGVPCKETKASSLFGGNCKSDACILENRNDRGGDDDDDNDDRTPRHSKDYFKKNSVSIDQLLTTGAPENEGQSFNNHFDESRGEKNITRPVEFHEARCEFQVNDGTNNPSPDDCSFPQICTSRPNAGTLTSVEPDLIIGIKGIHNISCRSSEVCAGEIQLNSNETEPLISDNNTRNDNEQIADNQEFFLFAEGDGPNDDPVLMEGAEARSLLQLSEKSPPMIDFACMATSVNNSRCVGVKRRGFLHKLNIKWPSKVKVKNLKRVQEITPEDFRETYLHVRNNGGEDLLLDTCGDCMNELATLEDVPSSDLASSSICAADVDENTNSNEKLLQITDSKNSNMNSCEQSGDGEKREVPATTVPLPSSLIHNTSSFSALPNADLTNGVPNESKFQIHVLSRNIPVPPPPTDADFSGDAHHEIVKMLPSHSCLDKQDSYCFSIPKCTSLNQKRPVDGDGSEQSLVNSETYKAEADQVTASQRDTSLTDESSPVCRDVSLSSPHLTSQVTSHPNFISRPESSASRVENYSTYRFSAFSLHKMSLGITDIPTPGSLTPNRLSPAPSEASKTESALSPPSDISKTESMSQLKHLNRIKEIENQHSEPFTSLQLKQNANIKVSPIVNNELEAQKVQEQKSNVRITGGFVNTHYNTMAEDENSKTDVCLEKSASVVNMNESHNLLKEEKPWYELSDDDEILMPETLKSNLELANSHFEDDDIYCCS